MTVHLVISLPSTPYIHRISIILANLTHMRLDLPFLPSTVQSILDSNRRRSQTKRRQLLTVTKERGRTRTCIQQPGCFLDRRVLCFYGKDLAFSSSLFQNDLLPKLGGNNCHGGPPPRRATPVCKACRRMHTLKTYTYWCARFILTKKGLPESDITRT
jgi:hypothetical protein